MSRFLVLAIAVTLCGCRDSAYSAASKADSIEAWRRYLDANPKDPNFENGHQRLEELEFEQARKSHTVLAYKRFLDEFPQSDQAVSARALLEALRFNAAIEKGTANVWRQFLREHPAGAHHEEAQKKLAALELAEVSSVTDPSTLARMVAENPDDPRSLEATAALDALDWSNAVNAAKTYAYLRAHPAGAHRDAAKARLLSLRLEALLVSDQIDEAVALAKKDPLAAQVTDFSTRLQKARASRALVKSKDPRVQRALPTYYLRTFDELVRALTSPDPMDRWDAAEELGFHVSVRALDPLLETFRTARSPLVRQKAFESLASVLHALPHDVAEYEVATRVEALRNQASDAQLYLSAAVLLDLTGQLQQASVEYQRAWDANAPDPVVLRRWASLRRERRQFFSAAVAARQLAVWATNQAQNANPVDASNALSAAREMCAAFDAATFAKKVIEEAKLEKTEFPEDLEVFSLRAKDAERLTSAKLRDAELAMLGENPVARKCGDDAIRARLNESVARRLTLVAELKAKPTVESAVLFEALRTRDPAPEIRAAARAVER